MTGLGQAGAVLPGPLATVVEQSRALRDRLDVLTGRASSGKVADTFAGLGAGAAVSLSLEPQLAHQAALQAGIDTATGRLDVTQAALSQISSIASQFYAKAGTLDGLDASNVDSVAADARDALRQVAGLLDTTDGGVYVFAGQDSGDPPVPNPDSIGSSGFAGAIAGAVGNLAVLGASGVTSATVAIASSNVAGTSPFSPALSQPATILSGQLPSVLTGDGSRVTTGVLASANAEAVSTGSSTTGSYTRDVLRALATLASLKGSQASVTGFSGVVADVRETLGNAITSLNEDAGVLGDREASLKTTRAQLDQTRTALSAQIGSVENVDMTTTLTSLSQIQTQLQASYQVIASTQSLSLVKYLGGG